MDVLERLLEHDNWGTTSLLELSLNLPDSKLDQSFDIGHRTLRSTLEHIVYYVEFWSGLMLGQPVSDPPRNDSSIPALINRHKRSFPIFDALSRRVRDENRLEETFTNHFDSEMTFGGAILHVILHDTEHRTEAVHILQRLDVSLQSNAVEIDHGLWDFVRRGF